MDKIYHRPIKRFNLSGVIHDDADLARLKTEYVKLVLVQMRLAGYVPKFDIDIDYTLDYNYTKNCYEFELSIYSIYVGKKKSNWILGIYKNRVLYYRQSKQKESSSVSESISREK